MQPGQIQDFDQISTGSEKMKSRRFQEQRDHDQLVLGPNDFRKRRLQSTMELPEQGNPLCYQAPTFDEFGRFPSPMGS